MKTELGEQRRLQVVLLTAGAQDLGDGVEVVQRRIAQDLGLGGRVVRGQQKQGAGQPSGDGW